MAYNQTKPNQLASKYLMTDFYTSLEHPDLLPFWIAFKQIFLWD